MKFMPVFLVLSRRLTGIVFLAGALTMIQGLTACGSANQSDSKELMPQDSAIGEALYRPDDSPFVKEVAAEDDDPVRIPDPVLPEDPATGSTPLAPNPGKFALKDFERRVVELTNAERQKRGLGILNVDGRLTEQCRRWSSTMATQRRMYHSRMSFSGENVAWNQRTPEAVVTAWMNSPGHRANILRSSFKSIGVSMVSSNGPYWCQQFGSR